MTVMWFGEELEGFGESVGGVWGWNECTKNWMEEEREEELGSWGGNIGNKSHGDKVTGGSERKNSYRKRVSDFLLPNSPRSDGG